MTDTGVLRRRDTGERTRPEKPLLLLLSPLQIKKKPPGGGRGKGAGFHFPSRLTVGAGATQRPAAQLTPAGRDGRARPGRAGPGRPPRPRDGPPGHRPATPLLPSGSSTVRARRRDLVSRLSCSMALSILGAPSLEPLTSHPPLPPLPSAHGGGSGGGAKAPLPAAGPDPLRMRRGRWPCACAGRVGGVVCGGSGSRARGVGRAVQLIFFLGDKRKGVGGNKFSKTLWYRDI